MDLFGSEILLAELPSKPLSNPQHVHTCNSNLMIQFCINVPGFKLINNKSITDVTLITDHIVLSVENPLCF